MKQFVNKVLIAVSISVLLIVLILIIKAVFNVILLVLAGALIAVYFRGFASWLTERTKMPEYASVSTVIIGTITIIGLTAWLLGARIQTQMTSLAKKLPDSTQEFSKQIGQYEWGRQLLNQSQGLQDKLSGGKIFTAARKLFKTTFGILGDIYVILFLGVFFTVSPSLYKDSIIALIPPSKKNRGKEIIDKISHTLRAWLLGKIFAMFVVAVLTGISLVIVGVPMALALALIAGLLNFIPNFGPLLSMIPAILVTLPQGTTTVLIVIAVYVTVQVLESNAITPLVQKRLIEIPPAYIIIGQVTMGVLTGAMGVLLATPIIAILMVLIQMLYIENLKRDVDPS